MGSVSLAVALAVMIGPPAAQAEAQNRPGAKVRSSRLRIVTQPELESATQQSAIIRWTANTAGGTAKHYGIVRYGTDPRKLDQTARSPIKWCKATRPNVTYRVRIDGLAPQMTYYYTVDVAQFDGVRMGLKSRVNTFTTKPRTSR